MSDTLTGLTVSGSYGRLVQVVAGSYYDGFGDPLDIGGISIINGLTSSNQYFDTTSDPTIRLGIISSADTHYFIMGWSGSLSLERGGLGNTIFAPSQILIAGTDSIISSGYQFNDSGTSSTDILSAQQIYLELGNIIGSDITGTGISGSISIFNGTQSIKSTGYKFN